MIGDYDDAVATLVRRGVLSRIDDAGSQQIVTVRGLRGERLEGVHRVQQPGVTHNPPTGTEGLLVALGGRSDRPIFIGGESRERRPRNLEPGGTILYDANGNAVSLVMADLRIVHSAKVHIIAPEIVLDGLVKLGGPDADTPASMQGTVDSMGHVDVGGFASRVRMK